MGLLSEEERLAKVLNEFSGRMQARLEEKVIEGREGWDDPEWIDSGEAQACLLECVESGDMVDAANFAMFIWWTAGR